MDTIINLSLISRKFNVPLEKVLDSVNEKRRERDTLAEDIEELKITKWLPFKTTLRHWKNWKSTKKIDH